MLRRRLPPKNGTQKPGPSICAGYGTVRFPTTAPTIQPVNWKKFMMYMSCLAGAPPELMALGSGSPQGGTRDALLVPSGPRGLSQPRTPLSFMGSSEQEAHIADPRAEGE